MFQGVILKEEQREQRREKEKRMTRGDKASVSEAHNFIFKRNFYTFTCTQREMKDAVIQTQPKHYICFVFIKTRIFSAHLSHKQCCVQYLLALEACGHFMTLF